MYFCAKASLKHLKISLSLTKNAGIIQGRVFFEVIWYVSNNDFEMKEKKPEGDVSIKSEVKNCASLMTKCFFYLFQKTHS